MHSSPELTTPLSCTIKVNGEIVGAIGVSEAPAVQNDVDCAKADLALVPDAADAIAFLASHGARWIAGASIPVDGGSEL